MAKAYIGLGSNLGDRLWFLVSAVKRMASVKGIALTDASSIYETAPVGFTEQPHFLNAIIGIETSLEPMELLRELHRIEDALGRVRTGRWGPRTVDADIIYYEGVILNSDKLTLPHCRASERAFVMTPLAEIAPSVELKDGVSALAAASSIGMDGVVKYLGREKFMAELDMLDSYELLVKDHFSAAHFLRGYHGKCSGMHGHNWEVETGVSGCKLDGLGMVVDLGLLKEILRDILTELDHKNLNEMEPFASTLNPTSENIARYIYEKTKAGLEKRLGSQEVSVSYVKIWEGNRTCVTYKKHC